MDYLIEKYDTEGKFRVASVEEKAKVQQWLHFQGSGQGCVMSSLMKACKTQQIVFSTYCVSIYYFRKLHPEKLPSAIKRYQDEVVRMYGTLESVLKTGQEWLVGEKVTLADLSFIM